MRINSPSELIEIIIEASGNKKAEEMGYFPVLVKFHSERRSSEEYSGDIIYESPFFKERVRMSVSGYEFNPEGAFRKGLLELFDKESHIVAQLVGDEVRFRPKHHYEVEEMINNLRDPDTGLIKKR